VRTLTAAALQAILAPQMGSQIHQLLTLDHASLGSPYRLVDDTLDMVHGGETYTAWPFEITLPDDTEERIPEVRVRIDNVGRQIMTWIRGVTSAPTVTYEIVHKAIGGTITTEVGPLSFRVTELDYDALAIEGVLGYEADYLNEPAVRHRFDPTIAPGLF